MALTTDQQERFTWAVIGGGNGGQSLAGHLPLMGFPGEEWTLAYCLRLAAVLGILVLYLFAAGDERNRPLVYSVGVR